MQGFARWMQKHRDDGYRIGDAVDQACREFLERQRTQQGVLEFPRTSKNMTPGLRRGQRRRMKK